MKNLCTVQPTAIHLIEKEVDTKINLSTNKEFHSIHLIQCESFQEKSRRKTTGNYKK